MQIGWALFLVSLAATPVPSSAPPAPTAPGPMPFMEPLHGEPRFDPYRWMEEAGSAFDVWARQESDWTRHLLDGLPGRARLHARIEQLDRPSPGFGSFQARGGRWLYTRLGDQASARTTFLREGGQGAERPLDLLRTLPSEEGPWSEVVHARVLSPNGRYLAFGTTRRGEADPSLRVYDLQTMQLLPDLVTWPLWADSSGFRPRWLADSSGFLYVRRPDADAAMDARERARRGQVFLHRLGTATAQDEPLFGFGLTHGIEETDTLYVDGEPDPRWLAVLNRKPAGREIWVADLSSGIGRNPPRRVYASDELVPGFGVLGDRLYTLDSDGAARYRVVAVDLAGPAAGAPVEVLPQQEGVLGNLQVSADAVYVVETRLDSSRLHIIDESGHRAIDLPQGSVESVAAGPEGRGVWIETTSWLHPRSGWLVEPGAERPRSLDSAVSTPTGSNPANVVELEWAVARDGVRVPYTIVRRADAPRDGSGYVLMSGYGCFGTVNSPFYWPALEAWLEQGGIFVLAHMRGGGELGAGWHLAGSDRNKATSFEDAIDTARQLVRNGWTRPGRVGVTGGSCGGATMGMAALEAPHLIGAAALSAAALDMNRIAARTTAGARTIREFGDPETPEGARRIDALSPYRQLLPGAPRPAFLIMSGATDYTIPLWVGGKFVASARAANPAEAPVLWRIDWSSGHNVGRDYAAEDADLMAFMLWQLGHPDFQWADGE